MAARQHTTWFLSFKLRDALLRLTCNDYLGACEYYPNSESTDLLCLVFLAELPKDPDDVATTRAPVQP